MSVYANYVAYYWYAAELYIKPRWFIGAASFSMDGAFVKLEWILTNSKPYTDEMTPIAIVGITSDRRSELLYCRNVSPDMLTALPSWR